MEPISEEVLHELRAIVGTEHVWATPEEIAAGTRDIGPWKTLGAAIVLPGSTEEVAAVLRVANREKRSVWTSSGGWNWGYGAAMGLYDGAIILLLRRMNRILEVDTDLAYAVIEPGVTQEQLRAWLDEHGTGLWTDCTDSTPKGSLVGNALEHGVGYTPLCDHFGALCGLEVVLADGTVARTGGAPEGSATWHTHRWGTGPSIDGLFGQSNLGVVTKAGLWLMPAPEEHQLFLLEMEDDRVFGPVADAVRELTLKGILRANVHSVNDVLFSAILGGYPYDLLEEGRTFLTPEARARLRQRHNITALSLTGGLYGTRRQVAEQRRIVRKALRGHGRLSFVSPRIARFLPRLKAFWAGYPSGSLVDRILRRLTGATPAKLDATAHVFNLLKGVPSETVVGFAYYKAPTRPPREDVDPARDAAGMIWSPVLVPLRGKDVLGVIDLARPLFEAHGFDYANTFISMNARTTMSLMPIWFHRDRPEEAERALALQQGLYAACQEAGWPQYRTGHSLHEQLFADAPGYQRVTDAIKRALDPNDILAPGRYGLGGRARRP